MGLSLDPLLLQPVETLDRNLTLDDAEMKVDAYRKVNPTIKYGVFWMGTKVS